MKIKVDINPNKIANKYLNKDVKTFANMEARRLLDPFVPFKDGELSQNVSVDENCIHYKSPYAYRVYNGDTFNFRTDHHPLATARWDKAAMASQKGKLAKAIESYINQKGGL